MDTIRSRGIRSRGLHWAEFKCGNHANEPEGRPVHSRPLDFDFTKFYRHHHGPRRDSCGDGRRGRGGYLFGGRTRSHRPHQRIPVIESGGGHSYTYTDRGIARFTMDAKNGTWSESGPDQTLTFKDVVLDGTMQPDASAPVPPGAGTYRCSGSSLTWMRTIPFSGTATEKRA